ncbi:MAG: hypothetical protein IAE80_22550 [Anaerolinea sp.]|nr:hypothetical protein [Anaerolinea sp.]
MDSETQIIDAIKQRGLSDALRVFLDIIEPLGIVGAQVLWIAQPAAGLIGGRAVIAGLAQTLEEPGGIDRLRALLDEDV